MMNYWRVAADMLKHLSQNYMNDLLIIYRPAFSLRRPRPLIAMRVPAGFPSPAVDYIEGRIDLNRDLVRHPVATFYIRVTGDSMMGAGIEAGDLLIVDRAAETCDGDIIVARVGSEMTVKRLAIEKDGRIFLCSANEDYQPIEITDETDFEVWGRVMYSIQKH